MGWSSERMKTNFSARTKYSNSPETDLLEEVLHIVYFTCNNKKCVVEVMAREPSHAIRKVRGDEE